MRDFNPDQICGLCDEYSVRQAAPEYAALDMGRCLGEVRIFKHVGWDAPTCISYRLDIENLKNRRQYVEQRRIKTTGVAEAD